MSLPEASALMKRGLAGLAENTPASLAAAVAHFEAALALRQAALMPGDHWTAYLLAASWMNRGDALTRLAQLEPAVHSYDEALAVLREVPLAENPLYRRRMAIAWLNRGITLQEQGNWEPALESFRQTIATVREHPEHALLRAAAEVNRGQALLRLAPPRAEEAGEAAHTALSLVAESERHELLAAETGLKARHLLCQVAAELLEGPAGSALSLVTTATDAVEEGLLLARHWEARGETCFRPVLTELLRFGVAVYRTHQPHFLGEFVLEALAPEQPGGGVTQDPGLHRAAAEALAAAAAELHHDGFASLNTPRFDRLLEVLRARQLTERRCGSWPLGRAESIPTA